MGKLEMYSAVLFMALGIASPLWIHAAEPLPMVTPEEVGFSAERLERLDDFLQELIDERQRAGFVYLVARHGKVAHFAAKGWADIEKKRPMTPETIFSIWSMTKPIAVATLLSLYEEGRFDLQDDLSTYIPAFAKTKVLVGKDEEGEPIFVDGQRAIEIWHLLSHSSGMSYDFWGDELAPLYEKAELWNAKTREDYANRVAAIPLLFEPGTGMNYAVGIDVSTRLVEIFAEKSFEAAMLERVLKPLGMVDTDYYVPKKKLDRFAQMYKLTEAGDDLELAWGEASAPTEKPVLPSGGGGLYSTVPDFWRFAQMLLNGGELDGVRVLGRKTVDLMSADALPAGTPVVVGNEQFHRGFGFGYGVAVMRNPAHNQIIGSAGEFYWEGGSNVYFWCDPEEDLVAVLMYQYRPGGGDWVYRRFKSLVYQALVD